MLNNEVKKSEFDMTQKAEAEKLWPFCFSLSAFRYFRYNFTNVPFPTTLLL
jgi:hypothetical protein